MLLLLYSFYVVAFARDLIKARFPLGAFSRQKFRRVCCLQSLSLLFNKSALLRFERRIGKRFNAGNITPSKDLLV